MSYRLDFLTVGMIAATALDAATTYYFISRGVGQELNPVLGPLTERSLIWIPIYFAIPTLLVPAMPDVCRQTFAVPHLIGGLVFGMNNLGVILSGQAPILDAIGYYNLEAAVLLIGLLTFAYQVKTRSKDWASAIKSTRTVFTWIVAIAFLEGVFYLAGHTS